MRDLLAQATQPKFTDSFMNLCHFYPLFYSILCHSLMEFMLFYDTSSSISCYSMLANHILLLYIIILSSEYEYESSKYHIIPLFLFYHYLLKDDILIKNFLDVQTFMKFHANLYSLALFYTNLTKFMLDLKFYVFHFHTIWEASLHIPFKTPK